MYDSFPIQKLTRSPLKWIKMFNQGIMTISTYDGKSYVIYELKTGNQIFIPAKTFIPGTNCKLTNEYFIKNSSYMVQIWKFNDEHFKAYLIYIDNWTRIDLTEMLNPNENKIYVAGDRILCADQK